MINEKLHNSNKREISLLVFTNEVEKRLRACGSLQFNGIVVEKAYKKGLTVSDVVSKLL